MKNSLHFFRIELEDLPKRLLKLASTLPFSDDAEEGFIIDSQEKSDTRLRYIFKEAISEEVEDPFGETISLERIRFDVSRIRVRGSGIIEISNPGRKMSRALKMLSEKVGCEPKRMIPNFDDMFAALSSLDRDLKVLALETGNFTIKSRTACRVSFQALVDVREDVNFFLAKRNPATKMARMSLVFNGREVLIEAYKTGRVVAHFDVSLEIYAEVVQAVITSLSAGCN